MPGKRANRPAAHQKPAPDAGGVLTPRAASAVGESLRALLADVFVLYFKTKNFHWHVRGPHFRDYHLLFDEQAGEVYSMVDEVAERARKIGETTLRSIGDVARHQRLADNDSKDVAPSDMLAELAADNRRFAASLREMHEVCERHHDIATASLIENWVDQAERRAWFLSQAAAGA
jgi:starvation-inducible DNA-binding protein